MAFWSFYSSLRSLLFFLQGTYEPGKRHWLKVKKDYLNEGAMADTADLVVLGAFYGQGSKGQDSIWPLGWYFFERPTQGVAGLFPGLICQHGRS